jgi:lipid-binding SYLF domain-containing protein
VAVIPSVKKAAFIIAGEYGKGVVTCRTEYGWSAPAFLQIEKGDGTVAVPGEATSFMAAIRQEFAPPVSSSARR